MKIEKEKTKYGEPRIKISTNDGFCSEIIIDVRGLFFNLESLDVFTQDEIKTLLPYLQAFAETGTLEPATESPLQGDEERIEEQKKQIEALEKEKAYCLRQLDKQVDQIADLDDKLTTMQEAGVAMALNIEDQGKRIDALQNLVKDFEAFVNIYVDPNAFSIDRWLRQKHELKDRTAQLLGKESKS